MDYLIDTHALIFYLEGNPALPKIVKQIIEIEKCYLNVASLWEIAIKVSLDKIELTTDFTDIELLLAKNGISIKQIEIEDLKILQTLPFIHRDPFDRLLIAQAMQGNYTLITKDQSISMYQVATYWKWNYFPTP